MLLKEYENAISVLYPNWQYELNLNWWTCFGDPMASFDMQGKDSTEELWEKESDL